MSDRPIGNEANGVVIPFPDNNAKRNLVTLKSLLRSDEEIADFYRFVYENDLRREALERLEKELDGVDSF